MPSAAARPVGAAKPLSANQGRLQQLHAVVGFRTAADARAFAHFRAASSAEPGALTLDDVYSAASPVDVVLAGPGGSSLTVGPFSTLDATPALTLPPGSYTVTVVVDGTTTVLATATVQVTSGQDATVTVYNATATTPGLAESIDNVTSVPAGVTRLSFRNASDQAVSITVAGQELTASLAPGATLPDVDLAVPAVGPDPVNPGGQSIDGDPLSVTVSTVAGASPAATTTGMFGVYPDGYEPLDILSLTTQSNGVRARGATPTSTTATTVATTTTVPASTTTVPATTTVTSPPPPPNELLLLNAGTILNGYTLAASDGGVFSFGGSLFEGSEGGVGLNAPVVAGSASPDAQGIQYNLFGADGGVFSFPAELNSLFFQGSLGASRLNAPIVGGTQTALSLAGSSGGNPSSPSGYWMVAADGGVFSFGNAPFEGSLGGSRITAPIVGMAATHDDGGYWLVGADGHVYNFGDAPALGSVTTSLNAPIVGIAATPDGLGYTLVASDGGVFTFGDAQFSGSTGGLHLNEPVVAVVPTFDGLGYTLVAADGGVFNFGDSHFYGSTGNLRLNAPVVTAFP